MRTTVLGVAGAGVGGIAGAARRRLRLTRHRVTPGRPRGRTARVVHLTDLHVGRATPLPLLRQAVRRARGLRPDLVVLTGDYLNHSLVFLPLLRRLLAGLPRPCVATLGNHDHWSGADPITRALEQQGISVLRNESTAVRCRSGRVLEVVGVDDGRTRHDEVARSMRGVRRPERALVLTHYPRTADTIERYGGRLVLAGHTHGGQIHVPLVTRALSRLGGHRYIAGWYRVGAARLYVNAGIGASVIGLRVGRRAAPELALIEV
jgi:predicted MPP superfamily phosphohydrolase